MMEKEILSLNTAEDFSKSENDFFANPDRSALK